MLRRLTVPVLGVLGAVSIALGIASATVWRADDVLVASGTASGGTTILVGESGVLTMAGSPVTVTAHAAGAGTVVIAIGRDTDVTGWVGSDRYTAITGFRTWHTLSTSSGPSPAATASPASTGTPGSTTPAETPPAAAASAAPADVASAASTDAAAAAATGAPAAGAAAPAAPDPTGSDMWVAQASGAGSASLVWPERPGRWSLLVATTGEGAGAPTVQLSWPQTVTTPWLVPGIVLGTLLLLVAGSITARRVIRRRGGLAVTWNSVETGETPSIGTAGPPAQGGGSEDLVPSGSAEAGSGAPLTRRQLRELERTAPTPVVVPRLTLRRREPMTGSTEITARDLTPDEGTTDAALPSPGTGPIAAPAPGIESVSEEHAGWARPRRDDAPERTWVPTPPPAAPPAQGAGGAGPGWVPEQPAAADTPVNSGAPTAGHPVQGARADAWRRAWGFPGVDAQAETETPEDDGGNR